MRVSSPATTCEAAPVAPARRVSRSRQRVTVAELIDLAYLLEEVDPEPTWLPLEQSSRSTGLEKFGPVMHVPPPSPACSMHPQIASVPSQSVNCAGIFTQRPAVADDWTAQNSETAHPMAPSPSLVKLHMLPVSGTHPPEDSPPPEEEEKVDAAEEEADEESDDDRPTLPEYADDDPPEVDDVPEEQAAARRRPTHPLRRVMGAW
jgi:hypothetical protein